MARDGDAESLSKFILEINGRKIENLCHGRNIFGKFIG
jgi:hypothetical protein